MDDVTSDPTTSSSSSLTAPPRPRLGFLSLPPEIRLEIYALLLVLPPYSKYDLPPCYHHHHHHHSSSHTSSPPSTSTSISTSTSQQQQQQHDHRHYAETDRQRLHLTVHASLLLTCRLIHAEATPILYSLNTFVAHPSLLASFPRLRPWCSPVREAPALALVRRFHLTLRLDCDLPFTRERAARAFSGADELTVEAVQSMFLGVGCANLRVLEGVRGVRRVRIMGSTTGFEEYVRWLEGCMMTPEGGEVVGFEREDEAMSHRLNIPVWPVTMKEIQAHG